MSEPYRTTPVFDETSLPQALRRDHSTKKGVWGLIRVFEGRLRLDREGMSSTVLTPETMGLVRPEEIHCVEPLGAVRLQVEFYDSEPG